MCSFPIAIPSGWKPFGSVIMEGKGSVLAAAVTACASARTASANNPTISEVSFFIVWFSFLLDMTRLQF
jgi:hypothetical protein